MVFSENFVDFEYNSRGVIFHPQFLKTENIDIAAIMAA